MQITFEAELLGSQHLPYELRESFYEKMRQTIVLIEANHDGTVSRGGGIGVGPEGLVLTASHILGKYSKSVIVRCHDESYYSPAEVIHNDPKRDLALLRRAKDDSSEQSEPLQDIHYVKCCRHDKITAGAEAYAIGHPNNLVYTFTIGHVSYPAGVSRDVDENTSCLDQNSNKRRAKDCQTSIDTNLQCYKPNLHVIQLNDLHGSGGASGGAVFNASGHLMGLESFIAGRFDYCVHVSVLQQFIAEGLKVEKETSSDGLHNRKKLKVQQIIGQGRGRAQGYRQGGGQGRGKGKRVSLTRPITEWENRTSCSLRLPLNVVHLGGDFDPLPSLKLDKPDLDLSDPLKTTENAKSHLYFLSLLGANSVPEALPQIEGYASLDHAKADPVIELYETAKSNVATDQCNTPSEATQFHHESSCKSKYSRHHQISRPKLLRSPLHSSHLPPSSIPAQTTASSAKRDFLNPLSAPVTRKSLPKYFVERMTQPNIVSSNLSMQKEAKPLRFPECKLEVPLKIASKTSTSAKKFALSSPSLKRKIFEEWEMDPESSKHRMATSTERRELEGILSTVDKKVVLGSGYEDNFCEEESCCAKYMVDVQLPVMSKSPKLNLNPSNESARELDDLSTYLKLNSGSVEKALACVRELDDICIMLRKKNEEAKELLACSIAKNNALMLLNHPMYDGKISLFLS